MESPSIFKAPAPLWALSNNVHKLHNSPHWNEWQGFKAKASLETTYGLTLVGLVGCESTFLIKIKMLSDHPLIISGVFVCLKEMRHTIFTQLGSRCQQEVRTCNCHFASVLRNNISFSSLMRVDILNDLLIDYSSYWIFVCHICMFLFGLSNIQWPCD